MAIAMPGRSASTARMHIGVWVGRPDGAPVPGLVGRTAAAPILFEAFARPEKLPVAAAGAAAGRADRRQRQIAAAAAPVPAGRRTGPHGGEQAPHIQFPLNGSRIDIAGSGDAQAGAMPVKVAGGVLPMTVLVNGVSAGEIDGRRQRLIDPPGRALPG